MAVLRKNRQFQVLVRSPMANRVVTLKDVYQTAGDLKRHLFGIEGCDSLVLSLNGRALDDRDSVWRRADVLPTVTVHLRALGGGGDGGATGAESRDCYLKMYAEKKPDKVDPNEKRISKWTTCALSAEPLKPPCVVDCLGNVFNKEALVKALLGKTLPKAFRHIRGLKDMIPVHLQGGDNDGDHGSGGCAGGRFQCPITGLEFNGKYKFLALTKCGHVLSAKALKEIKSSSCLVCHAEFQESDNIVINGTDDEVAVLRERMEAESEKKVKKKKNKAGVEEATAVTVSGNKHGIVHGDNPAKAKVKKFKAVDIAPPNANKEVYASIFTSSSKSNFKETYSCRSLPLGRN